MSLQGEFIFKTGDASTFTAGDYCLLREGLWVKIEAGNLLSGPYYTADGTNFSLATGGGGGGGDTQHMLVSVTGLLLFSGPSDAGSILI